MADLPKGRIEFSDPTHTHFSRRWWKGDPRLTGTLRQAQPVGQRGAWECPRCRAINAWWVRQCGCKPGPAQSAPLPSSGRSGGGQS